MSQIKNYYTGAILFLMVFVQRTLLQVDPQNTNKQWYEPITYSPNGNTPINEREFGVAGEETDLKYTRAHKYYSLSQKKRGKKKEKKLEAKGNTACSMETNFLCVNKKLNPFSFLMPPFFSPISIISKTKRFQRHNPHIFISFFLSKNDKEIKNNRKSEFITAFSELCHKKK